MTDIDQRGIEVRCSDGVTRRYDARTVVWAAGVRAAPIEQTLAEQSGAPLDPSGRVVVEPDCSLPGHPEVFVVGDLMSLGGLAGVAEVAMHPGPHAARVILSRQRTGRDGPGPPLRYRDLGSMATIARFRGVARIGPVRFGGFAVWLAWLVVHLTFLTEFKNRLTALLHWTISFLGRGRAERTITEQQVVARLAIAGWEPDPTQDRTP